jgi:hypothetical protein
LAPFSLLVPVPFVPSVLLTGGGAAVTRAAIWKAVKIARILITSFLAMAFIIYCVFAASTPETFNAYSSVQLGADAGEWDAGS